MKPVRVRQLSRAACPLCSELKLVKNSHGLVSAALPFFKGRGRRDVALTPPPPPLPAAPSSPPVPLPLPSALTACFKREPLGRKGEIRKSAKDQWKSEMAAPLIKKNVRSEPRLMEGSPNEKRSWSLRYSPSDSDS